MKKILLTITLAATLLTAACPTIENAVNNVSGDKQTTKFKNADVPTGMKNSLPDVQVTKDTAVVVTVLANNEIYVGAEQVPTAEFRFKATEALKNFPKSTGTIHLNVSGNAKYADLVKVLDMLRREGVNSIGFFVTPAEKSDSQFNVLEAKLMSEPNDDGNYVAEKNKTLIKLQKDGKILFRTFDQKKYEYAADKKEVKNEDELAELVKFKYKDNERDGVFLGETNEIENRYYIKASKSVNFAQVARIIDAVRGADNQSKAGGWAILQIDDLEE